MCLDTASCKRHIAPSCGTGGRTECLSEYDLNLHECIDFNQILNTCSLGPGSGALANRFFLLLLQIRFHLYTWILQTRNIIFKSVTIHLAMRKKINYLGLYSRVLYSTRPETTLFLLAQSGKTMNGIFGVIFFLFYVLWYNTSGNGHSWKVTRS